MAVKVACVVFDCADALTVARFWSAALHRSLDLQATSAFASIGFTARLDRAGWAAVERDDDPTWIFAQVPEAKPTKNRLHLDFIASDLNAEIARLVELGATRMADRIGGPALSVQCIASDRPLPG